MKKNKSVSNMVLTDVQLKKTINNENKLYKLNLKQIKENLHRRQKCLENNYIQGGKKDHEKIDDKERLLPMDSEIIKRTAISLSPKKDRLENDKYFLPPNRKMPERKTLVLDLDETLVHSTFDPVDNPDIKIPIKIENSEFPINVLIRPKAYEFIEELSKYYEIVIFTASMSNYADPLITTLDINKRCEHRLFREHCTYIDGAYIKDMSLLGRNLRNIVIVDNSPISFSLQESNGIPIKNWYDDRRDEELSKLLPILQNLSGFYDVRTEIQKFVTGNTFIWNKAYKWLQENSILYKLTNEIEGDTITVDNNNYLKTVTMTEDSVNTDKNINSILNSDKILNNLSTNNPHILNNPNININIINGDYNQIVLTEVNDINNLKDSIDIDEFEYKPSYTEINIPQEDSNNLTENRNNIQQKNHKKSPIFYNFVNKPQIKKITLLKTAKQIERQQPLFKEPLKIIASKNANVKQATNSNNSFKNILNTIKKENKLSVDLRTFNFHKIIKTEPSNSKQDNLQKNTRKFSDTNFKKSPSLTKRKSIDFNYLKRDLFRINPIEKLKFIKVKSIDLTVKNKNESVDKNYHNHNSKMKSEYNSLNFAQRLMTENILIQDESKETTDSKSKEKIIHNQKFFKMPKFNKNIVVNNFMTEPNVKINEVKKLYSGVRKESSKNLNEAKKDNYNEVNVKHPSISTYGENIVDFKKTSLNKIKVSEFTAKNYSSIENFSNIKLITKNLREGLKKII